MKTTNNNLIGVIGDTHFREFLSYEAYISDRRVSEKKEILDFIVESFKDCKHIVFMGDIFHSKNNSSVTYKEFVEFIERFDDKELYILSGNHEKKGDGTTAIDFLKEIQDKNWHIFTKLNPISVKIEELNIDFLPYMLNSELEVTNYEDATKAIMKQLSGGDILFAHHAISDTSFNGIKTNLLNEVVLPKDKLEKKYKLTIAGHIHEPQEVGQTIITGNVFTTNVGEIEKFIWKIKSDLSVEKIKLPGRAIYKIENPTNKQLSDIKKDSIVKIIITDKKIKIEELKEKLKRFDSSLLVENYPSTRKKMHIEDGAMDFRLESLLKLYSEERKVNYSKLLKGLEIINV